MGIVVKFFVIYLIVASLTLDDVATSNLSNTIKDGRVVIEENGTENQMQEPKPPVDAYEQLATDEIFPSRLRRSIDIETVRNRSYNAVISGIAKFIREGKGNLASQVYFTAIQTGTRFATSKRTELVKQIITDAYQQSAMLNILEFISSKLKEPSQVCVWLTALFETIKNKDHLASIEGLQLEREIQKVKRLQNSKKNIDSLQECDLQLLAHRISNDLIKPTEQLVAEWAKSIQSGNDSSVISAAIKHPLAFHFVVGQLIPKAIGLYNLNNQTSFFDRCKKTIDFINQIPSLVTTIDALDHFIETLYSVEPKAVAMSEGFMLAYSVKEVEAYVANTTEFPLKYQQKLTKLKNRIPQNIKKIVWDPYVLIYKQNKTSGETKFMSTDYREKSNKCQIPSKSNRTDESNKWILEPINNADLFRIKNKESGEYLYAEKNYTNYERSVCTYKLNEGSDVNINSLGDQTIWTLIPRWATDAEQFGLMNLWKEYLDDDWNFYNDTVFTWIVDPPDSEYNWIISDGRAKPRLVCLFNSHASHREGAGRFTVDNIDPSLCTHLIYSEAKLGFNTLMIEIGNEEIDIGDKGYEKFVTLKYQNPDLKVMILLSDHGMDEKFLRLSSNTKNINKFIESIINFLQRYKFDGIHIDVEYWQSKNYNITSLITALSDALKSRNYLLSATLSPSYNINSTSNDIPRLNQMLDFISIRGYHYNQGGDKAYHHTPLFHRSGDEKTSYGVVDIPVKNVISQGVSPSKIVLGISFCGTPLTLISDDVKLMAPTRAKDHWHHMFYSEICAVIKNHGWQEYRDLEQRMGPYAVSPSGNDRTWVSYDDPAMAIVKSKYILSKGLGGAYVWEVSMDDFRNICGNGVNPMLTAIANTFREKSIVATKDP